MARMEFTFPLDVTEQFSEIEKNTKAAIELSLEAGGKVIVPKLKANLKRAIGNGIKYEPRSTGELLDSVGVTPVKTSRNNDSTNVKVGFNEPRRIQTKAKGKRSYYTVTNAMVANVLEYGKRSADQPPRPFIAPTAIQAQSETEEAMRKAFEEAIE